MTTSRQDAGAAMKRSTASSQQPPDFSGREPLEFGLMLPLGQRRFWLARRLEAYRDASVLFARTLLNERTGKSTVAEAEAQGVLVTDGLTKLIPLEAGVYSLLFPNIDIEVAE